MDSIDAIKITALGHASLIYEMGNKVLYCDPLLQDSHHDGIFDVYPPREVDLNNLPYPTHLYISHSHYDHFDIKSISAFPRDVEVIIPKDPLIKKAMDSLGFSNVHVISDWQWLDFGEFQMFFTRSELRVPENGVVITTPDVKIWNMVDSDVTDETLRKVKEEVGEIDVAHIQWNPFFEANVQYNREMAFPLRSYVKCLRTAAMVNARLNIPGASGYRYSQPLSWQNNLYFPITRERFIRDFQRVAGSQAKLQTLEPGDCIMFNPASCEYHHQASEGVRSKHNWNYEDFRFDPNMTKSVASDALNATSHQPEQDNQLAFDAFLALFRAKLNGVSSALLDEYRMWEVVYQINIHSKDEIFTAHIDFSQEQPMLVNPGSSPYANMEVHISNQGLWGLINQTVFWDYLVHSGAYRCHKSIFQLGESGITVPSSDAAHDPLWIAFPYQDAQRTKLARDLAHWQETTHPRFDRSAKTEPQTTPARTL